MGTKNLGGVGKKTAIQLLSGIVAIGGYLQFECVIFVLKGVWHEIFPKIREWMFISGVNNPAINSSAVSTTPVTNLSVVSLTPAINLCHRVVDTGDKFINGVVDTTEKWSPVTTTSMKFLVGVNDTGD